MVKHVIDTAHQLGSENIHLIYGHGGDYYTHLANEQVKLGITKQNNLAALCSSTSSTFL